MSEQRIDELLFKKYWTSVDVIDVLKATNAERGYPEQWEVSCPELTAKLCRMLYRFIEKTHEAGEDHGSHF